MRRLVPVAGAVLLGPLAVVALLVAPHRSDPPPADPSASTGGGRPVDRGARPALLLERAAAAPATTPYRGVQFVSAWTSGGTTSEVVDVDHVPGRGTTARAPTAPRRRRPGA